MVGNAGKDISEPRLRVDLVELGGSDEAVHDGGALTAPVGAAEQPWVLSKGWHGVFPVDNR